MKLVILLCFMLVCGSWAIRESRGRGSLDYRDAEILRYENEYRGPGRYRFAYDQTDGTARVEEGELRNEGQDNEYIVVRGRYKYLTPDNRYVLVNYVADENGYQPDIEEGPGDVNFDLLQTALG